jgi:tetratricopeptide (TPR) repeat protein
MFAGIHSRDQRRVRPARSGFQFKSAGAPHLNKKIKQRTGRVFVLMLVLVVLSGAAAASYWILRTPPRQVPPDPAAPSIVGGSGGPIGQTIFLSIGESADTSVVPRALNRELVRQAFLMAARDELGLATRDVILREDYPSIADEKSVPFTVSCDVARGTFRAEYSLFRGSRNKTLWRDTVAGSVDDPKMLLELAEKAEVLSRGEFKDILARAGAASALPAARQKSEVPQSTDDLLWSFDEISVLAGLRHVHAEIRDQGESPELLAALAAGYANLGALTDYYHSSACKGYHARALLYAERLLRKTGEAPWALWQRAYVRTIVGLHNAAAADIAAAKKDAGPASAKQMPFWTDVVAAFVEGNLSQMREIARTPAQRRLAQWLDLDVAIHGPLREQTSKLALEFLKTTPACPRVLAIVCTSGELGPQREAVGAALGLTGGLMRQRLPVVPGLPPATAKRIRDAKVKGLGAEVDFRRAVIADLKQAGAPGRDRGEPSLSALGHHLDEMHYIQTLHLVNFLVNALSAPADQEIAAFVPLCTGHPDGAYLAAFSGKKTDLQPTAKALTKSVQLFAVRGNEQGMLKWIYAVTRDSRTQKWSQIATQHIDLVYGDQIEYVRSLPNQKKTLPMSLPYLQQLLQISDKLPSAIALRIDRDWPHAEKDAQNYEHKYAHEPLVTDALAERYFELKRYGDAERCAKLELETAPSYAAYRLLAKVYKSKGDRTQWKAALDRAITLPDEGLERATIQNEIALDLLRHKQFKEAVVYADAAAESYSGWSMMTAARCHERLGEWTKSEKLVRATAERYEGHMPEWMYWCHRTQHGDAKASEDFVRKTIESWGTDLRADQSFTTGIYYLVKGQPDQALGPMQRAYSESQQPADGVFAAIVADTLGKKDVRDQLLKQVVETKLVGGVNASREAPRYQALAELIREVVAQPKESKPDLAKVDRVVQSTSLALSSSSPSFIVAVIFKNRGDVENAQRFLLASLQTYGWHGPEHALASDLLRQMKVDISRTQEDAQDADPLEDPYGPQ